MAPRSELQMLLETLLGSQNVYFQPPPDQQMIYPCIVYRLSGMDTQYADNAPYRLCDEYSITVIDRNPDSEIPKKIAKLQSSTFSNRFPKDGLNHTIFTLYF